MATRKDFAAATRPRNALATRAAILEAARACFTEAGYEHVGVRDVAARAGVNGALVIRYFGSKVQLFEQAFAGRFSLDYISDGRQARSTANTSRGSSLRRRYTPARFDAVLALVRSAPDPQAAAILKRRFEDEFIKPMAALTARRPGAPTGRADHRLPARPGDRPRRDGYHRLGRQSRRGPDRAGGAGDQVVHRRAKRERARRRTRVKRAGKSKRSRPITGGRFRAPDDKARP